MLDSKSRINDLRFEKSVLLELLNHATAASANKITAALAYKEHAA
jgi:hypothetical protein